MGIVMSEIDAVNAVLAAHVAAVNACDIDANLAGFSDDQVYMPPNAPPMHGKPDGIHNPVQSQSTEPCRLA